jgi:2-oxo-4-hydroxy-4-carboxy-5-ureidoimidazoline decarboxylase
MTFSLAELNLMNQRTFTESLGTIFEQTPAIAQAVWPQRPFKTVDELYRTMFTIVESLSPAEQLTLVRSHPDLGAKVKMAESSVFEQASVGLNQLSPSEYVTFQSLNQAYKDKFNFPFIIAVRKHTKASILQVFEQRLQNTADIELQHAISEIGQIAYIRLLDLITTD